MNIERRGKSGCRNNRTTQQDSPMVLDVAMATLAWVWGLRKSLCKSSWFDVMEVLFWARGKYEIIQMSDENDS